MNRIDYTHKMGSMGRNEDRYMAHVAPGEMVVPPVISKETRNRLHAEMVSAGLSPSQYTVGGQMSINPITDLPEFGFLKSIFKTAVKILPSVAGYALGGPVGGAIGSGVGSLASGGNIGQALLSAGGSYLGGQAFGGAGSYGPSNTVASGLGSIGFNSVANALPASLAGASLSDIGGSYLGSSIGESLGAAPPKPKSAFDGASAFSPSRAGNAALPPSLSQLGGMDPQQQSTGIATQGVYGGGQGGEENQYFLNLINQRLVDDQGQVGDIGQLQPVEQSYLSQLGLGGYGSSYDLLKAMSSYKPT